MTLSTGNLDAGTYETRPFADSDIALTLTMPGGWEGFESWGLIGPGANGTNAPDGIGLGFMTASGLYTDPCHWDAAGAFPQPGDIAVGPTVDDLVAALRANRAYVASAPADVTVDGYSGRQLELQLPSDVDIATCGSVMGSAGLLVWSPPLDAQGEPVNGGAMAGPLALGPGSRWNLRILDVEGTRIIILVGDYAGTPSADQAAAQAIVDSIQITR
jgi:hypothetical protein